MPANDRWNERDVLEDYRKPRYPEIEAVPGLELTHGGSGKRGVVAGFNQGDKIVLVDDDGRRHVFRAHDGAFTHNGRRVALRRPARPVRRETTYTASGSVTAPAERARVAQAGRIWVEGLHDAELVEKVWGDDLRSAGVAVEPLHGADQLSDAIAAFQPSADRPLGVLLDHLVPGSKESRLAATQSSAHVLIRGHPYVDVWQAVRPDSIGISEWPEIPRNVPWKDGVVAAVAPGVEPGAFWARTLASVTSYRDLETPLVNAVEQLIDFVTAAPTIRP